MGPFNVLGNYLTYSGKQYLKSRREVSVAGGQRQPLPGLRGPWGTRLTELARAVGLRFVSLRPALGQTRLLLVGICNRRTAEGPQRALGGCFTAAPSLWSSPRPLPEQSIPLPFFGAVRRYGKLDVWRLVTQEGLVIPLKGSGCS